MYDSPFEADGVTLIGELQNSSAKRCGAHFGLDIGPAVLWQLGDAALRVRADLASAPIETLAVARAVVKSCGQHLVLAHPALHDGETCRYELWTRPREDPWGDPWGEMGASRLKPRQAALGLLTGVGGRVARYGGCVALGGGARGV